MTYHNYYVLQGETGETETRLKSVQLNKNNIKTYLIVYKYKIN